MSDGREQTGLTIEEKAILSKSLARFERSARRWRYSRYCVLAMICFLYIKGFGAVLPAARDALTMLDKQEFIDGLSSEPIPADVTARNWIVGYVNKIALISAYEQKLQSATQLLATVGAIMLTGATLGTVLLLHHWNDGKRDIVIAKVLQGYLEKQIG
jgi:hypothetical protein